MLKYLHPLKYHFYKIRIPLIIFHSVFPLWYLVPRDYFFSAEPFLKLFIRYGLPCLIAILIVGVLPIIYIRRISSFWKADIEAGGIFGSPHSGNLSERKKIHLSKISNNRFILLIIHGFGFIIFTVIYLYPLRPLGVLYSEELTKIFIMHLLPLFAFGFVMPLEYILHINAIFKYTSIDGASTETNDLIKKPRNQKTRRRVTSKRQMVSILSIAALALIIIGYVIWITGRPNDLRVPNGFRAVWRTGKEPFTGSDWAQEIIHRKTGMRMVFIPPGDFLLGSPEDEEGRNQEECPQHNVQIDSAFYMGKFPVTQAQYFKVINENPSYLKRPDIPVFNVTWQDCQRFLIKLNELEEYRFRLPTEAEWEYSCRAGTITRFYSGDKEEDLARVGWYSVNMKLPYPHPVGLKEPNSWGLYDMHGNVAEWCQSLAKEYPYSKEDEREDTKTNGKRIYRGMLAIAPMPKYCRSASRFAESPGYPSQGQGFRVLLPIEK